MPPPVTAPEQHENDFSSFAAVKSRLRLSPRLLPDFLWTFGGNFFTALSGLFIFKIISRYVPAQEYGKASLVLGVAGLLSQFLAGPMVLAQLRLYFEQAKLGFAQEYATAIRKLLLVMAAVMSAIYLALAFFAQAKSNPIYLSLAIPAVLLIFTQTQLSGTLAILEGKKQYRGLMIGYSLSKVLQVPALILFVYLAVSGPTSVVLSQAIAALAVALFWGSWQRPSATAAADFSVRKLATSAMRSFGFSLYLFTLFGWLMATSDRYIIGHYWTTREVGIYAINYGLWSMPYMSLNAWLEGLVRSRIFERAEAEEWPVVRRILLNRLVLTFALCSLLTAFIYFVGKRIAIMIIGERYWHSETLMLLICAAHFLYIFGGVFYNFFIAAKRVRIMSNISFFAALTNVVLNIALVPRLGIIGAAWSTLAAYGIFCGLFCFSGSRLLSSFSQADRVPTENPAG
ncbi:MAG: polysaccharide biosynthesis protein [Acidobacteriales bacterium]|nr:polysaccharide biosynthesis protein [Terriglobales bacterium]